MSDGPPPTRTRRVPLLLAFVLTLGALVLVVWQVEPGSILEAASRARPSLLALALSVALFANTFGSAEVLAHALSALGVEVSRGAALAATLENMSFQAALPFGAGHASRALTLARGHGVDPKRAALSVPVVLGLKLGALSVFTAVGAATRHRVVLTVAAVVLALGFTFMRRRWALHAFALVRALGAALVLTALQITIFALSAAALGATLPLFEILLRFPICLLLAKLPVTWMGFGTREAAVIASFQGLADPGTLAAAALLFGVFDQIVPGLVGLVFTPGFARRISDR